MPYRFQEKFEKYAGYRFFRDKKSILVQALAYGRKLSDQQIASFGNRIDNQISASITSGFNCALFCGTALQEGTEHANMLQKFGQNRIKIEDVSEFTNRLSQLAGAYRSQLRDVVYTDQKNFVLE